MDATRERRSARFDEDVDAFFDAFSAAARANGVRDGRVTITPVTLAARIGEPRTNADRSVRRHAARRYDPGRN